MLSFLDVLLKRVDGSCVHLVYRKRTFYGLYMKYDRLVPIQYKRSLVYGLVNRSNCHSVESFEEEVKFKKTLLVPVATHINLSVDSIINTFNQSKTDYPLAQERNQYLCYYHSILQKQLNRIMGKVAP